MKTALDVKTYKYKINGIDTILWRPADKDRKRFGLFQQNSKGDFVVDVLNKYYNIPPYDKGKFDSLYEQTINKQYIIEINLKDILKKVKHKLKKFKGETLRVFRNKDKTFNISTFGTLEDEEITKHLKKELKGVNLHRMTPEELKILLSYLWPHKNKQPDSEELDVDQLVDEMLNMRNIDKDIVVDMEALNFLKTGMHGLA